MTASTRYTMEDPAEMAGLTMVADYLYPFSVTRLLLRRMGSSIIKSDTGELAGVLNN